MGLWHAFRDWWHGAGLRRRGTGALTALLSGVTWVAERVPGSRTECPPASVALAWTLLLAMPAAATSAYLAGRVVTTARWPRALAALVGLSASLWSRSRRAGCQWSRPGPPPAVLSGYVRVSARDASGTATFATALATAVVGVCVPAFLVLATVAALVMLAVGPGRGRRVRAPALLVPTALTGAWVLRFVKDPVRLLAAPGLGAPASGPYAALPPWQSSLGLLARPGGLDGIPACPGLGPGRDRVGMAIASRRLRPRGGHHQGAALCLAVALAAPRVVVGALVTADGTSAPRRALARGRPAALPARGVRPGLPGASAITQPRRWPRWRRGVLALVPVAVAATTVGGAAWLAWTTTPQLSPSPLPLSPPLPRTKPPVRGPPGSWHWTSPAPGGWTTVSSAPSPVRSLRLPPRARSPRIRWSPRSRVGSPRRAVPWTPLARDLAGDGIGFVTVTETPTASSAGASTRCPG